MCFAPQRRALFDSSTSKSAPNMVCFVHFGFQMCFAPQRRRPPLPHHNFQKCSGNEVLLAFWLRNVLRHNGAHCFDISQLPKAVRTWGAFYILTWKCALRNNGMHFFDMSTSKRGPSMWCFYYFYFEMCFAPPQRRALFHVSTSKSGPNVRCFLHFDFQMCFAPQQHAILHLSPSQMAPHPPL